jgi:UDP-N-acetylglucosamine:LPS N-acetylglucosamine transferase
MAGGYNSFHEAVQACLPTICLPNLKTGRDDQLARAKVAEEAGCMIVITDKKRHIIHAAIDRLIDSEVREIMRNNYQLLQRENGSEQVSSWILDQAGMA